MLLWRFGPQMAIRSGDWKLVRYDTTADTGKANKGANPPVTGARLYNLRDDVGEKTDLSAKMPEKAKELQAVWDRWNAELVPPLWGGGKQ